ncbi:MAG: choloylglycine hydrolase family protein [Coxiellaceae bacterium]|nr:choloylglycine hydrolase family protein [Coxiellaceae bacterium]
MKTRAYKLIPLISLTASMAFSCAQACTFITIKAQDGSVMAARTMEFGPNLQSLVKTSPRGREFSNTTPDGKKSMSWKSKYGYVYMNYFGLDHSVDGMNEQGLTVSSLYLPGYAKYPPQPLSGLDHAIPYMQAIDWILGSFKTVAEAKAALENVTVFSQPMTIPGHGQVVFPLHDIVTDATGQSIVIEWVNGKQHIYDNPLGILTNAPTFDWQTTNLKNYANLSPYSPKPMTIDGYEYSSTGQGSGMVGLPGDTTPPSRFVKMAFLTKTALPVADASNAMVLAQHIIENVYIPKGLVRGTQDQGVSSVEITQWTVFKDLTNHVLYFNSYGYPQLRSINLDKLNLTEGAPQLSIPIASATPQAVDITEQYKKMSAPKKDS